MVGVIYALIVRLFTYMWVPHWTLLFIGLLPVGGVQMISIGVLGE